MQKPPFLSCKLTLIGADPTDEQRKRLITMAMGVYQIIAYRHDVNRQLQEIREGKFFAQGQTVYILRANQAY